MCEGGKDNVMPSPGCTGKGSPTCVGSTEACCFLKHPGSSISKSLLGGWGWGIFSEPGQAFWLFLASAIVCVCVCVCASGGANARCICR